MKTNDITKLSTQQLRAALKIKREMDRLNNRLARIAGRSGEFRASTPTRRKMSAAGRKAISIAAKKRWAKFHAAQG